MKLPTDCVCRSITNRTRTRPLVFLTSADQLPTVRNTVAVSLPPGSSTYGAAWEDEHGRSVGVKSYTDKVPAYPNGFDLQVCSGGLLHTPEELAGIRKWRKAASG